MHQSPAPAVTNRHCKICGSSRLHCYLDLGETALANAYSGITPAPDTKFPLQTSHCLDCHNCQLNHTVDRSHLFEHYAYFASASQPLFHYFKDYAGHITERFPKQSGGFVVEVASGEGLLLEHFLKTSRKVLGIDPAVNIVEIARQRGIDTIADFFTDTSAEKILQEYGQADVILANHVLAHSDDPHGIVAGVKTLLNDRGVFIFEVQYLGDMLAGQQFDMTYHEHVFYFSLCPLIKLLEQHGLAIFDVQRVSREGGSLRVYIGHVPLGFASTPRVDELMTWEQLHALHDNETYVHFGQRPAVMREQLLGLLRDLKKQRKRIVGYGAPAKGNTLLQYCGIGPDLIDYITDTTPYKQGKFTPGSNIPIYPPEHLLDERPDYLLLLTRNYVDAIIQKEAALRAQGVQFIVPIPEVRVI